MYNFSISDLEKFKIVKYHTKREKRGKIKDETWKGVYLGDILKTVSTKYQASKKTTSLDNISSELPQKDYYSLIKCSSIDNYMIRLTVKQIEVSKPIIALEKNGKKLSENKIRLVSPNLRDIYWISGINKIETEKEYKVIPVNNFFIKYLNKKVKLKKSLPPFERSNGYYFKDIASEIFSNYTGEYVIIGEDGMLRRLNYKNYLSKAILEYENGKYTLKSPQMPAGMWIKNIIFIQGDNHGLVLLEKDLSPLEILKLLKINIIAPKIRLMTKNKSLDLPSDTKFSDKIWEQANSFKFIH